MGIGEYFIYMAIASFFMFFVDKIIAKMIIKKFGVIKIFTSVGHMYLGMALGILIVCIIIISHTMDFLGIYILSAVFGLLIGLPGQIYGIQQKN